MSRPRLLYVVTSGLTARHLLRGHLAWMREHGFEVAVAAAPGADLEVAAERERVEALPVPIQREIAPAADLRALVSLTRTMRRWKPDLVNASTPKAGLLGMMAARLAGVPVRLYTVRGLRLETASDRTRRILEATERIAASSAHRVVAVSASLAEQVEALGLARDVRVLAGGSSNGVEAARFAVDPEKAASLRADLRIPIEAPVVGFVGRFTRDKGLPELVEAFGVVRQAHPEARLLLVGDYEAGDPVPEATRAAIERDPAVIRPGFVTETAPYYGLMDVLAFPSHREGFPNVPLEAAAAGVPVVGFRATGTSDAVADGETGRLVPLGDAPALAEALLGYLGDPALAAAHGAAGQQRAREDFAPERVWQALADEYHAMLAEAGKASGR